MGLALVPLRAVRAQGEEPSVYPTLAAGSQKIPSVDTPGVAFGRFILSADGSPLSYAVRILGLNGTVTGMSLHRGRTGTAGEALYDLAAPTDNRSRVIVAFDAEDEADLAGQGLYLKIRHTVGGTGVRMPMGGSKLPAEKIATITTWIEQAQ